MVVLTVLILLAAVLSEDLLTCLSQPAFALCEEYLRDLAAEISLVFLPSLLPLLAVSIVSVYAFKLQLRLAREIQPTVNIGELEESRPRGHQNLNNKERKETNESEFDVPATCFCPLSVLVERIMMLNIAALILVLIFILNNCIRLYFILTREKCDEISIVFIRLIKFLCFLLSVLYVFVIKKKLST